MGALEGLDDGKGVTGETVGWSVGAFEGDENGSSVGALVAM